MFQNLYNEFFNQIQLPHNFTPIQIGENYRKYNKPIAVAPICIGFSGPGFSPYRALKVEWYQDSIHSLHNAVAQAHNLRNNLLAQNINFSSGHDCRASAHQPNDGLTMFAPFHMVNHNFVRTDGLGFIAAQNNNPLGVTPCPNEVGLEHAGGAGRVVVWMPIVIRAQTPVGPLAQWASKVVSHF
jgi:hypothetical protein